MTICVSVKVHDCIVFAADSASSLTDIGPGGQPAIINVWRHGIKVFNLHKGLPIAAMTCGLGSFGPASISMLAKDLRLRLSRDGGKECLDQANYTIGQVVERAHAFFAEKYAELVPEPSDQHSFEFWIGGYGADQLRGEIWKIRIVGGQVLEPEVSAEQAVESHVGWGGQPEAINRLLIRFDVNLGEALVESGIPPQIVQPLLQQLQQRTQTPLVNAAMPIQDAINLAEFLVDVTKRYFAFLPGADIVGGDTDIATVTKHEGFRWISRKHYYPASLNPMETGHVT